MMELFRTLNQKFEELGRLLVIRGNKFDDTVKSDPEYQSASCWTAANSGSAATSCREGRRT